MKTNPEYEKFSKAMDTILKADPKAVKAAMEADKKQRENERKVKRTTTTQSKTKGNG
jgi:hypothetical protein